MDRETFLLQFALARATRMDNFNSLGVVKAGLKVWDAVSYVDDIVDEMENAPKSEQKMMPTGT